MKNKIFPKRFFDDWPAKVLSLAAALLVFFFFNLTRLEQRYLSIPLVVSLNDEFVPSSQFPRTVRVSMRGERDTLYTLREDDIAASVDLSGYRSEGAYSVPVHLERRGAALAVDPLELSADPGEIVVGMERKTIRSIPVTPSFRGFLEPGFELVSFELEPAEVEISGPAGAVARATDIATESIELGSRKADFSVDARLVKKDNLISLVDDGTVQIRVRVRKTLDSRTLENVRVAVTGLAPGLALAEALPSGIVRLHVSDGSATVPAGGFDSLLSVDLSALTKPGSHTVPVAVNAPAGTVAETFEPQSIIVKLVAIAPEGE